MARFLQRCTLLLENTTPIKRVLLAEDDEAMRDLLATVLELSGLVVEATSTADGLLARIEAARGDGPMPDAIVSDLVMPGTNGLDALSILQRIASEVPVVVITAFGSPRTHQRARELGAVAVFDKPFDLEQFSRYLCRLCAREQADSDPVS